ncbi:MAG TPA: hypothetical protein VKY74_05950 [Chloroflexia bacterium]|nr:hypothetical protein [Chloroflexia bacterium]
MDPTFSALLAPWHEFYQVTAAGAATFLGLLFVAISINLSVIVREEKAALRAITLLVFSVYLTVFFAALLLLLPDPSRLAAAWTISLIGGVTLALPGWHLVQWYRMPAVYRGARFYFPWLAIPVLLDLGLIRVGFALSNADADVLRTLAYLLAGMLLFAAIASWRLLVDVGRSAAHAHQQDRDEGRDRGLERQLRALVREQRAQNRRAQDPPRPAAPPPATRPPPDRGGRN